ncbi:hypothetical protein MRX96_047055 [Rhipicephalus microplus]
MARASGETAFGIAERNTHEGRRVHELLRRCLECKDPRGAGWEKETIASRGSSVEQPEEREPNQDDDGAGNGARGSRRRQIFDGLPLALHQQALSSQLRLPLPQSLLYRECWGKALSGGETNRPLRDRTAAKTGLLPPPGSHHVCAHVITIAPWLLLATGLWTAVDNELHHL